jgi:hypothetical protein
MTNQSSNYDGNEIMINNNYFALMLSLVHKTSLTCYMLYAIALRESNVFESAIR